MTRAGEKRAQQEFVRARIAPLATLAEKEMRGAMLREQLTTLPLDDAALFVDTIILRTLHKDRAARLVYEAMIDPDPFLQHLGVSFFEECKQAARVGNCVAALQWLLSAELRGGTHDDPEKYVHRDLRSLELGSRRALARRADRHLLDRLMVDPDPYVIENLLNHPHVTETIVLGICTRRPTLSPPLETVLRSRRWLQRYRVKLALVQNPHFAPKFAVNLLALLQAKDLRVVAGSGTVPQTVRAAAQRLVGIFHERHQ